MESVVTDLRRGVWLGDVNSEDIGIWEQFSIEVDEMSRERVKGDSGRESRTDL